MKQLFTATLLVISFITAAQNTTWPTQIDQKDIYIQLINTTPSQFVENVNLTKEQNLSVTSFENRIKLLLNNASSNDYDALLTRDGSSAQLIKYTGNKKRAKVPNYFGKEVYFLSQPSKKHIIIATKAIDLSDLKKPFYHVSSIYSKNKEVIFDAVIIEGKTAKYIQFK